MCKFGTTRSLRQVHFDALQVHVLTKPKCCHSYRTHNIQKSLAMNNITNQTVVELISANAFTKPHLCSQIIIFGYKNANERLFNERFSLCIHCMAKKSVFYQTGMGFTNLFIIRWFGNRIYISIGFQFCVSVFERLHIEHSSRCFITFLDNSNFFKSTPLRCVWKCDETLSLEFYIITHYLDQKPSHQSPAK